MHYQDVVGFFGGGGGGSSPTCKFPFLHLTRGSPEVPTVFVFKAAGHANVDIF